MGALRCKIAAPFDIRRVSTSALYAEQHLWSVRKNFRQNESRATSRAEYIRRSPAACPGPGYRSRIAPTNLREAFLEGAPARGALWAGRYWVEGASGASRTTAIPTRLLRHSGAERITLRFPNSPDNARRAPNSQAPSKVRRKPLVPFRTGRDSCSGNIRQARRASSRAHCGSGLSAGPSDRPGQTPHCERSPGISRRASTKLASAGALR